MCFCLVFNCFTPFINKPVTSRDLTILMTSFTSSFEIINVVIHDLNIFLSIAASVTDGPAVNPNVIKTLLANGLRTASLKSNQLLVMVPKVLLKFLLIVLF